MVTVPGIITKLDYKGQRVEVHVDGHHAFDLPSLEGAALQEGQTLSDAEIAALQERSDSARANDMALRYLSYRDRSAQEIRRYLQGKDIADPVIEDLIARFTESGYIDDAAFAKAWVKSRPRSRPRGRRALLYELRQKGISPADADAALEGFDEIDAARALVDSRLDRLIKKTGGDWRQLRLKLRSLLSRYGFNGEAISDILYEIEQRMAEE